MPNRTFEIWEGFREASVISKILMYLALLLIGVLSYFGAYFFFWNIALAAVIGISIPIVMLLLHSFSIRAKTEDTSTKGKAIVWTLFTLFPIAAFAFFGTHALGIHTELRDDLKREMDCLSDNITEAAVQYNTDKSSVLTGQSLNLAEEELLLDEIQLITESLKEEYQPFSIGTVMKDSELAVVNLELLYTSLHDIDSTSTVSAKPINRSSLLNNIKSLKAGSSILNSAIILVLIMLSFAPVITVAPPMRG